jgi:beta-mannosidase
LNLELNYADETSDFRDTNFPARYIYERVLPDVVKVHTDVYYHRASPYSGHGKVTTDQTFGDIHQCMLHHLYLSGSSVDQLTGNVWHGTQEPWHNWDILAGRFVSEFGMSACVGPLKFEI